MHLDTELSTARKLKDVCSEFEVSKCQPTYMHTYVFGYVCMYVHSYVG